MDPQSIKMWMNFKQGEENNRPGAIKAPVHNHISRQNSRSSKKSNSSTSNLQKKIEEYCFKTNTEEWKKEQEYKERRRKKKLMKKQVANERKIKQAKALNTFSVIAISCGIILTLGSCIRSISEGTFLWEQRHIVGKVGPIVLVLGIVLLMVAVAFNAHIRKLLDIDEKSHIEPFIHPDFLKERRSISRESSSGASCELDDSYRPLLRRDNGRPNKKWFESSHFNTTVTSEDSFLSSSTTSNTTSHESQHGIYLQNWANSVTIRIPEEGVNELEPDKANVNNSAMVTDHLTLDKDGGLKNCDVIVDVPEIVIDNLNSNTNSDSDDIVEKQYLEDCKKESMTINSVNDDAAES